MIHTKEEIIAHMEDIIHSVPSHFYADILFDSMAVLTIKQSKSGTSSNVKPKMRGFVFRIFNGKKYFEISHPDIFRLKSQVKQILPKLDYFPDIQLIPSPKNEFDKEFSMKQDFTAIPIQEKINQINSLYKEIFTQDSQIRNVFINFQDSIQERIFLNTEGSRLRQVLPRLGIQLISVVKSNGKVDSNKMSVSGQGGWEIFNSLTQEQIQSFVKDSIEIAQADLPPSGVLPIICDPSVAGMLAHAIFGHGVQADTIVEDRSYWKRYFNLPVASDLVNISDSAQTGAYGNYYFDDEGILNKKTPLVENGILTHYLHSRITATMLDMPDALFGNGRRQNFLHPIYPRNSNTFIEPGDYTLEEMISEIQYGLLVENGDYGIEEFDGSVQCNSISGYLIENGELKKRVKGVAISGQARDLFLSIDAVSKGPIQFSGINSRKGLDEWVPVTYGGVYIKAHRSFVSPG
ncbi:MAG: TldD/PmbA family protein [Candidatus Lokiarchaeota archaeon]|nr:TldD/PmbA family protein [Candidatus Harpocratesius repetitus]